MDQDAYDVFKQKTNPRKDNMMTNSSLIALLQAQRGMTTCKVSVNSKSYTYKIPPGWTSMWSSPSGKTIVSGSRG